MNKAPIQPYILGALGEHIELLNPAGSPLYIRSVAHNLARLARFTGCTRGLPYSVAQHSVLAARVVREWRGNIAMQLDALMHDATEAFLNDISSPLKSLLPDYQTIEQRFEQAIRERYGLKSIMPAIVHAADRTMVLTEYRDLMPRDSVDWEVEYDARPMAWRVRPWPYWYAEWRFMREFRKLYGCGWQAAGL